MAIPALVPYNSRYLGTLASIHHLDYSSSNSEDPLMYSSESFGYRFPSRPSTTLYYHYPGPLHGPSIAFSGDFAVINRIRSVLFRAKVGDSSYEVAIPSIVRTLVQTILAFSITGFIAPLVRLQTTPQ
jgi:hypothetical protein